MIFSKPSYLSSLSHIGAIAALSPGPVQFLHRTIPNTRYFDLMGPWPYSDLSGLDEWEVIQQSLRRSGAISASAVIRPDAQLPSTKRLQQIGFEIRELKNHFIIDPTLALPTFSSKTRRNIKIGSKNWNISFENDLGAVATRAHELQKELEGRRSLSDITRVPLQHFAKIVQIPGIVTAVAEDEEGISAIIIAAQENHETHFIHLLASEAAFKRCAVYRLMQASIEKWITRGKVYIGGAPAGADGPGITKFKSRWSNRCAPVHMLYSTIEAETYSKISTGREASGYFPAYRSPSVAVPDGSDSHAH